ncbi:MAG TPA: DNA polymerase III subunit epsilon [Burkholderiales bacterium]|nr:DNA polymerase III subunit epsilon [Burkholderiales bacterium]
MRQIILDTETTGLDPTQGHRIIEIAGVEIHNRRLTGNHFHRYVNPERASDDAALQIHGLTTEFLSDKPKFREIVEEFLEFAGGAELVIHNAAFDVAFLDYELKLLGRQPIASCCPSVVDSLRLAKDMYPGKRNGLDALCDRYEIDRSARSLHGALLDARLLAEVYLAMTRGQESLVIDVDTVEIKVTAVTSLPLAGGLTVLKANEDEEQRHLAYLGDLDKASRGACLWMQYAAAQQPVGAAA